jgi:tetratricopeptide (TPR) repeat protein
MLELLGKRLVEEGNQVQIVDPLAQQLYQSGTDFELVYDRLLTEIVATQYIDLANSEQIINQISELNMVYLLRRQLQSVRSTPPSASTGIVGAAPSGTKETTTSDLGKASSVEGALRRAEERMSKQNWVQAVPELREVISAEPNNVRAHTLLGLVYLRQQQLTMAKISINKAVQLAPRDPQVIQAKQEFDRASNPSHNSAKNKTGAKKSSEGIFGLFGKK